MDELLELICLVTVKWFQVFLSKTNNSIYHAFLRNMNNLHTSVWFQITNNNPWLMIKLLFDLYMGL